MLLYSFETVPQQLPYIFILGVVTTALGHTLFLNSFKHFTIGTASIISSIQPIFGILIAMVFLGEIPHYKSLIGGSIILLTVIIESLRSKNR
jgi:drug/metabolite transporter (DMT)-like permease